MSIEKSFQEILNDEGDFLYDEEGFSLMLNKKRVSLKWKNLHTAIGFKRDLITVDSICLQLFFLHHNTIELYEELRGWFQFLNRMAEEFPQTKGWEDEIVLPAFATNLTVVYDYKNRSLEEISRLYYKE